MSPNPDYYIDDQGNFVMTEAYHLKRGSCCGNGCKHCPFDYVGVENAVKRRDLQSQSGSNT